MVQNLEDTELHTCEKENMISFLMLSKSFGKELGSKWLVLMAILSVLVFSAGCENQMSTQRGVISGLVLDDSGNRITGAMVTSHRSLFRAETDKNGRYEFTSLDEGSHRLSVDRDGFYIASKTVELGYGQVLEDIDILVENLPDLIQWQIVVKETNRVVVDVECAESMSIWAAWREVGSSRLQTHPTEFMRQHQVELTGLFPGAEYQLQIEGQTNDGRKFVSEANTFKTVHRGDVAGAPSMPEDFKVRQSSQGPMLSWLYKGLDPLEGFRIYKSVDAGSMNLLYDEKYIFAAQNSITDEMVDPGKLYAYAIQAVDLEGNVSSLTTEIRIIPSGRTKENLVWRKSWNPINVNGDLIVPAGKTLTLEPGVNIVFSATDEGKTGYNPEFCEFIVEGALLAEGTAAEAIRMINSSSSPTRADWDGIRIIADKNQTPSILKYVEVAGAENGLAIYNSSTEVSQFTARYCQTGVSLHGSVGINLDFVACVDCDTGLLVENTFNCQVGNLQATGADIGVQLQGNTNFKLEKFAIRAARKVAVKTGDRAGLIMRNGVMHSYATGLDAGGAISDYQYLTVDSLNGIIVNGADVPVIKNNIIINRQNPGTGNGIEDKTLGRSYAYNNIFGFYQATFNCNQDGGPILNLDPLFIGGIDADFDYHLKAESPVVSASDRGGQPGAYGSEK